MNIEDMDLEEFADHILEVTMRNIDAAIKDSFEEIFKMDLETGHTMQQHDLSKQKFFIALESQCVIFLDYSRRALEAFLLQTGSLEVVKKHVKDLEDDLIKFHANLPAEMEKFMALYVKEMKKRMN